MCTFDVVVIGAGMIGSAAARHLSDTFNHVLVIGPKPPASQEEHKTREIFGAHYDEGRIARVEGSFVWETLARRSINRYRELEESSGHTFFQECGYLVTGPSDHPYIVEALEVAHKTGMEVDNLPKGFQEFPYLEISDSHEGVFESKNSGIVSPKNFIDAELTLAKKQGCKIIEDIAVRISKCEKTEQFTITTKSGRTVSCRRVLLAAGAFTNFYELLPKTKKLDLNFITQSACLIEVTKQSLDELGLRDMPPMYICEIESELITRVYLLPPIEYPDGKIYIKIGHGSDVSTTLESNEEVTRWYQTSGSSTIVRELKVIFGKLFPHAEVLSSVPDPCVVARTPTLRPYVTLISKGFCVVAGGNGWAGKSADELGLVAAKTLTSGKWDYDMEQELFSALFKSQL